MEGQPQRRNQLFKNTRIFNYYLNQGESKGRSLTARFMDLLATSLILTLILLFILFIFTQRIIFSASLALISASIFAFMLYRVNMARAKKIREQVRKNIGNEILHKDILQNSNVKLDKKIIQLFTGMENFDQLQSVDQNIIKCKYQDKDTLIVVKRMPEDMLVTLEQLLELDDLMEELQSQQLIVITTSKFTNAALKQCNENQKPIVPLDRDGFFDLLNYRGFFPSEEKIDELEDTQIFVQDKKSRKDMANIILNRSKIKSYLFFASFLFISAGLVDKGRYYQVGGVILSILGFMSYSITILQNKDGKERMLDRFF